MRAVRDEDDRQLRSCNPKPPKLAPGAALGPAVLCQRGEIGPASSIEPKLHELPITLMAPGAQDAAVLRVVAVEEPVLEPRGSSLSRHVPVHRRHPAAACAATRRSDAFGEDALIAVVAKLGAVSLESALGEGSGRKEAGRERETARSNSY